MALPKMREKVQPKVCTSKVRNNSEVKACRKSYTSYLCPDRANHLLPMVTGFCNSGWHEGTKPRSPSGKAAPTCKEYVRCPCDCHTQLWRMFELSQSERVLVDNSDYLPDSSFVRVALAPVSSVSVAFIPGVSNLPAVPESPAPGIVPASVPRTFAPTPTGRTARGELESWVREITDIWAVERDVNCTPLYVAREIGRVKGVREPSDGAVNAVFVRWEKLGFATFAKKPVRFTGYTEKGIELGLERMKAIAKRNKR